MADREARQYELCAERFYHELKYRAEHFHVLLNLFYLEGINLKDKTPIYYNTAEYALVNGEAEQYQTSYHANISCKEAIEAAIENNYRNNSLGHGALQQVLNEFSYDRIFYVLANTIKKKERDGRISRENKVWAQTIPVCQDTENQQHYFVVDRCNPGLVDLFLTQVRRDFAKEHEKKPSIHESMKQNTEQTATGHKPAKRKETER